MSIAGLILGSVCKPKNYTIQFIRMKKILIITGPTAVGKTRLGSTLAQKFDGDILSADSRQVYKGMDIVTGKDLPLNVKRKTLNGKLDYWETPEGVRIWLVDLIEPQESFSVSQWMQTAKKVLERLRQDEKLPIIIGATGFYIKALIDGIETIDIPPDQDLRKELAGKKANELYEMLNTLDRQRAQGMNESDRKNPRRLIRAIEVALQKANSIPATRSVKADFLILGLTAPKEILFKRIDDRVEQRMREGAVDEARRLLEKGVSWDKESMTGTGYRQLRGFTEGKMTLKQAEEKWKIAEHKDAKKQMAWFKKDPRVNWTNVTEPGWQEKVEKQVKDWYSKETNAENDRDIT